MVYVDDMRAQYGRMIMCHMVADTLDELHAMADKIGVSRRWFQNKPGHPHYDIALSKKKLAIQFGAQEITTRQLVAHLTKREPDSLKAGDSSLPEIVKSESNLPA